MESNKNKMTFKSPDSEKPTTIRRDWLKEAYKIAKGDQTISPKKEHIKVAIDTLISIRAEAEKIRNLMMVAYKQACKNRQEQGLPLPPMPPSLMPKDH